MAEVPSDNAVEFPLSILIAFDGRPSHVDRGVSVQPLLPEHRGGGGGREDGCGEVGVQHRLHLYDHVGRAGPLWERRDVATEGSAVHLVDQDAKKGVRLVVGVWLESGTDLDECGCHGREQTSLRLYLEYVRLNGGHDSRI